jgi:hypothetical protein
MVLSNVSRSGSGCSTIVKSYSRAHHCGGLDRKIRERLEAIAYARVARFGFEDGKGGIGPRQRALTFDPHLLK